MLIGLARMRQGTRGLRGGHDRFVSLPRISPLAAAPSPPHQSLEMSFPTESSRRVPVHTVHPLRARRYPALEVFNEWSPNPANVCAPGRHEWRRRVRVRAGAVGVP